VWGGGGGVVVRVGGDREKQKRGLQIGGGGRKIKVFFCSVGRVCRIGGGCCLCLGGGGCWSV